MEFRKAKIEELQKVYELYESVKGSRFCVWNAFYPGVEEVCHDFETGNLYILTNQNAVIGALSVVPEKELDIYTCWTFVDGTEREIARVVVAKEYQGRGLSQYMVEQVAAILQKEGCGSIHLSVVKGHVPALKTYMKAGFHVVGEADMYGDSYFLMEKMIKDRIY